MNYPFENDTSAVIKKLARKSVRFDKKKNLFCLSAIIVAVVLCVLPLVLFVSFSFPDALIVKVSLMPLQPVFCLLAAFCC